ncbi:PREDICTED: insulin-like 3 [Condylura cristata]|uniref:insulin-like 3 n=1 Tax=Condylura cristata TaxID=143302 RepID=UPI000334436F|nr:PREDICTED: insulin-like 3 [Condylura cristata]
MDPRVLTWALILVGPALALALLPIPAPEAPEKLCGHHFVRALVRLCGGPRWSSEDRRPVAGGDRELLQWLEGQHLLRGLAADGAPALIPAPPPPPQASHHSLSRRQVVTSNPAHQCCLRGCTRQKLLSLCPH